MTETPIWSCSPSQWRNVGRFLACGVFAAAFAAGAVAWSRPIVAAGAVIPAFIAFLSWLRVRTTRIDVTTERISVRLGALSRRRSDMELYRVKDTTLSEPFLLRLVRRANIEIVSSDRSSPNIVIPAIADAEGLREQIRANVERLRRERGIREMDMDVERLQ